MQHARHITIAVTADVEFAITIEDDGVGLPSDFPTRVDCTIWSAAPNIAAGTCTIVNHDPSGATPALASTARSHQTRIDRNPVVRS